MQWLSFVETVFVTPPCSNPPCTSCKLQVGFGAGSPRKFLDFNSLKSHFLGLQVIIKDRILVRFQLGKCFFIIQKVFIMKNLTNFWWKPVWISLWDDVWEMSAKTLIHTINDYMFSFETVFITRLHPITLRTLLPIPSGLAWENGQHFARPPLVSLRDDVWEMSSKTFILLTCHYGSR